MIDKRLVAILIIFPIVTTVAADERLLERRKSAYNEVLVTETGQGLRVLRFEPDGARQTVVKPGDPEHLELPYARVIPLGLALADDPQRVLIVGLGGGTIPSMFRKHLPELRIDAVEIDPVVVDVARRYFGFREDAAMRAYVQDGRQFIQQRTNLYDVIFLDAFGADSIPHSLTTREFLQSVRRALKPGGLVVGNIWSRSSNWLYDSMIVTYQDVFDSVYVVDIQGVGNKLVIGLTTERRLNRQQARLLAAQFSKRLGLRYELGQLVDYGFRLPGEDGVGGRVLRDSDREGRRP
ncbi:MAG: methyltransferase domain-containing protein [Planctomycetaceae bacterium]|nr:MAG: methyltransferase domain-containing protein [Planctomycetaceae bacterium]